MISGIFVTGTDTGVGKTRISTALIETAVAEGYRCVGMKPVACGCEKTPDGWRHADALDLMRAANVEMPYEVVNPYALIEPIAPHLAAEHMDVEIEIARLVEQVRTLQAHAAFIVAEGAGGIVVPLNDRDTQADLIAALGLPVLLVVGIRLGCLNHALLSADYLHRQGLPVLGWVASRCDGNTRYAEENIETLERMLEIPLLGIAEYAPDGRDDRLKRDLKNGLETWSRVKS
ncbi:MAG: dethiobiotin synthase [Gammaproteobacteria bacterium]|nr:dethiobiotin synthase [Gammaproteobacteria bacterium]